MVSADQGATKYSSKAKAIIVGNNGKVPTPCILSLQGLFRLHRNDMDKSKPAPRGPCRPPRGATGATALTKVMR